MTGQRLLPGPDGLYIGVDPGTDGALAVVRREGERLTLLGVAFARLAGERPSPGRRARLTLGLVGHTIVGQRVVGVAVEAPAARAMQSGALVLAQSAGAYAGVLDHRFGLEPTMPRPEEWLADLACLSDPGTEPAERKALHIRRLLDVCPGAAPHITPHRARLAHDGGADAALIALWAAGLRGPGPSSPLWRLAVCESPPDWLARVRVDTGEAVAWPTGTAQQLSAVGGGGRWAAARGRVQAEPSAVELLRGVVLAGSPARAKAASAALLAWGVTDVD